ncbi:hypothetical protein U1Q18_031354, partial [Sarracenia purpurea var. burkii]
MEIKGFGVSRDLEVKFGEDLGETTYLTGKDDFAKGAIQESIEFSAVAGEAVEKGIDEEDPGSGADFEPEGKDTTDERQVSAKATCGGVPLVPADKAEPGDEGFSSEVTDSDSEEEVTSEEVDLAAEEDEESPDPVMEEAEDADVDETAEDNEAWLKVEKGSAEEKQRIPMVSEANLPESTRVSVIPYAQNVLVEDGLSPGSKDGNWKIQVGEKVGLSSHAHKVFDDLPQQVFMTISPSPVAASCKFSTNKGDAKLDEAATEDEEVEIEGVSHPRVPHPRLPQPIALGEKDPNIKQDGGNKGELNLSYQVDNLAGCLSAVHAKEDNSKAPLGSGG